MMRRRTRNIDLLATGDNSASAVREAIAAVCAQPVEAEDGITFLPDTLHMEERAEGRIYQGMHVEMQALLATARLRLEIDIAFGEAVIPPAEEIDLPTLLDKPAPRLRAYQKETAYG